MSNSRNQTQIEQIKKYFSVSKFDNIHICDTPEYIIKILKIDGTLKLYLDNIPTHQATQKIIQKIVSIRSEETQKSNIIYLPYFNNHDNSFSWKLSLPETENLNFEWEPKTSNQIEIETIQKNAWKKTRNLKVEPSKIGDLTAWTYSTNPVISPVILANPDLIKDHHHLKEPYVIFAHHKPVMTGTYSSAMRFTEETTEKTIMTPLAVTTPKS